ncbi:MAG: efflux RND transporter periplasmic adaptor subunit [Firmicutes bacterium]|nr:efflux RND transporter periplasmic adaptor subunit [Bacillota bacterium]
MKRKLWVGLGAAGLLIASGATYLALQPKADIKWRQVKIESGNITQRINATGAVSPVVQVAVGTQVSGVISALYVDYNSIVKKGQLIAQIDPTVWDTQLQDAQANLMRAQASYDFAKADFERSKRLASAQLLAAQDLETKETTLKTATGNLTSSKAALERAKANRAYCDITAPVDGIVISRLADVGQTVAASFSTPNLFQIAQDLSRMKVQVSIGESDIDEVQVGQQAMFTVDSLPEKQFRARVSLVRQEPVTTNNVVNYVVEMIVANEPISDGGNAPQGSADKGHDKGHERTFDKGQGQGPRSHPAGPGGEQAPDPEKAWERMKDRLPEGMTKEAFMKRFKERQAQRQAEAKALAAPTAKGQGMDLAALARTPGGASQLPGKKFAGDLALRPGMTANVTILTNMKRDVLRVPNAALRFNPNAFIKDDKKPSEGPRLGQPMMMGPGGRPSGGQSGSGGPRGGMVGARKDQVWVLEQGKPKALPVKVGLSDGQFTEVSGEGITVGLDVLVGVENPKNSSGSSAAATPAGGGRR